MYIAIGIAAALFAADRILKYLSRTGKLKWERRYVRLTHLENRGFFLGLGQKHEKLLRWLPLGVWLAAAACLLPELGKVVLHRLWVIRVEIRVKCHSYASLSFCQ